MFTTSTVLHSKTNLNLQAGTVVEHETYFDVLPSQLPQIEQLLAYTDACSDEAAPVQPHYPHTATALANSYCGLFGHAWALTDATSDVRLFKAR